MSAVTIMQRPGLNGLVPNAFVLRPRVSNGGPPVVAIHGIQRDAAQMAELLASVAAQTGRIVVVPLFDRQHWRRFQLAACQGRADWALLRLISALCDEDLVSSGRFDLSGYSGGGQFAHRFTWLYPHLVRRLCVTAPGWWTFADPSVDYPFGIGSAGQVPTPLYLRANLRSFLDREIVVRVGSLDTHRDEHLRLSPELDEQQGVNRVERAQHWVQHIRNIRASHGLQGTVDFRVLPDCAHSFADCVAQAALDRDFVVASSRREASFHKQPSKKEVA